MYIYKIWADIKGYDTYDSAVVIAKNEDDAKMIHPDRHGDCRTWATSFHEVFVKKIGVVTADIEDKFKEGEVICSSFNAG